LHAVKRGGQTERYHFSWQKIARYNTYSVFLFSGHEPIYFIENKEKTLRASYDRGTQIVDYMD
jgi:hypothetical protein